ncbi:IP6K2-like protein [Mya arenaria]|uniref:Kinase n=1 Tax=Mya arenaria TaxID=6604 RepID=A0ABY7EN73_MYAAR|nr:inositol hexakisphosphate kinase 2-like [Mya arenaria]WAR09844.1 IP6K2-like protein [Mya arenaria]
MSCHTFADFCEDEPEAEVTVELRPFKHQVGGHSCVLELGSDVICKPLFQQEQTFYKRAPESLRCFIPRYLGETSITCDITKNQKCFVAKVSRELLSPGEITERCASGLQDFIATRRRKKHISFENEAPTLAAWSNSCIGRQITQYGFWANNKPQKFIMLENLVKDYKRPCLMDLKMGKRQLRADLDAEKRKVLETRCASSTSAKLGFRICGSQSYKKTSDSYTFNQYHRRRLNDTETIEELKLFFHNGAELRTDIILALLTKLAELEGALLKEKYLDLHSSSLLLIYEGMTATEKKPRIESRKDAHASDACEMSPGRKHGENVNQVDKTERSCSDSELCSQLVTLSNQQEHNTSQRSHIDFEPDSPECKVDVRLIDFAHASESLQKFCENPIVLGLKSIQVILRDVFQST